MFVEILLIAQAMGLVKLGTVSLDGTKIKANAGKHKAQSWEHANRLEEQLKGEVEELMRLAEQADNEALPQQLDIPLELQRREQRLAVIAAAKEEISARAQERLEAEFEQAYNAQAGVDIDTHLIVEQHVTEHTNDKQEVTPALERLDALPEVLAEVDALLADTGYHS